MNSDAQLLLNCAFFMCAALGVASATEAHGRKRPRALADMFAKT